MKIRNQKKIIISSYDDLKNPVYAGGGAYAVHQLAKRLSKKYEVTVLTGTYKKAKNQTLDNVQYLRVGSAIFGHKIGQLIYQYALLKYTRKLDYDVWIESSTPPFTFSLLPLFSKKPVIAWINMLCGLDMQRKYKLNFRQIEQELCKLYKYVVTPTDWVKKEVRLLNPKTKISTIAPGVTKQSLKNHLKKKPDFKNYLLFIGRIEINQKGLDLLIKALSSTQTNTKLILAGNGSSKEEIKLNKLIAKYSIGEKIKRVRRIQGTEKEMLLRHAKAIVIPSRFETFSLTALEGIMHQKTIICFSIPQLSWIPQKFALKIEPFSPKKLGKAIDKAASTKISAKISIRERKKFIKKYNWENATRQFQSLIAQISA